MWMEHSIGFFLSERNCYILDPREFGDVLRHIDVLTFLNFSSLPSIGFSFSCDVPCFGPTEDCSDFSKVPLLGSWKSKEVVIFYGRQSWCILAIIDDPVDKFSQLASLY